MRVAMVGQYGGMWREHNPGCFFIGYKTHEELKKRLPHATIDIYSIDNKSTQNGIQKERLCGLEINYFSRKNQLQVLENQLSNYDAVVFGGDIIWGGDDVVADNDIFFVNSARFLKGTSPLVLFNSVHTFYTEREVQTHQAKFTHALHRSQYCAVRTEAIQKRFRKLGLPPVYFVPDPVLDLDITTLRKPSVRFVDKKNKPLLGISIRKKLSDELISVLHNISLDAFQPVAFAYSRQYENLETLKKLRGVFGDSFIYVDEYLDPIKTYQLIGEFDLLLTDTYHGVIAAILHRKPFISLDVETEETSRKQQLLETVGIDTKYNVRLRYDHSQNARKIGVGFLHATKYPVQYDPEKIRNIRTRIQSHYDEMARIIKKRGATF